MMSDLNRLFDYFADKAQSFSGHYGLAAQRIEADTAILYHADDVFPTASVIKLAVVAEYLAQVDAGTLAPDQPVVVRAEDQVGGSGVLKDLQPGLTLTLHDIATLSMSVSDNTAANLLIEQVGGISRINVRLQDLEMFNTRMGRSFVFDSAADNIGTPADFLSLLLKVAHQQLISPAASQQMLDLMRRQQFMHYIPRYLPIHPFATEYGLPQTIAIANKVGMLRGTVNDAALIAADDVSYALVIFTRDCQDDQPDPDNEAAELVAQLSKRVYDFFLVVHQK
jgi:beta-lactamase class A